MDYYIFVYFSTVFMTLYIKNVIKGFMVEMMIGTYIHFINCDSINN